MISQSAGEKKARQQRADRHRHRHVKGTWWIGGGEGNNIRGGADIHDKNAPHQQLGGVPVQEACGGVVGEKDDGRVPARGDGQRGRQRRGREAGGLDDGGGGDGEHEEDDGRRVDDHLEDLLVGWLLRWEFGWGGGEEEGGG